MIASARPTVSSDRLLSERVRLLFRHVPAMLAGAGIVSLVLAFSVRHLVHPAFILGWLGLILAVGIARVSLHRRFARVCDQEFDARQWVRAYVALSIVSGGCWGASAFLIFPTGHVPLIALFLLVIASLSTGSTVSHSSVRLAPVAWSAPAMLPYAARLVAEGGETAYILASLVVVYLLTTFRYSLAHHAAITEAISLKFENVELVDELRETNARMRHDIEERQKAEAALKAGEIERQHLEAQLAQSQRIEAVGRLAGGVAHDYNNMLTVITGHAEMALMSPQHAPEIRGNLEQILSAAKRSADLTGQLLAFARRQPVKPRVVDLNAAVAGTLNILKRLAGEGVSLTWSPGGDVWAIEIDPTQLDQILANLAVNARDAMAGTGTLRIQTGNVVFDQAYCAGHLGAVQGEYAQLTVADSGSGISPEIIGRIFEPFFTTKPVGRGTGLGLSTVYGIVKQNRGFITAESEVGCGATFMIALPRARAGLSEPARGNESAGIPRGSETLLIVEDSQTVLDTARPMLASLGYRVLVAGSAIAAIDLAREHPGIIDLVITDVVMPVMNGHDLAERLAELRPGLRVLYTSGYSADVIGRHGVLEEGVHFVSKPFSLATLSAGVRQALDAPAAPPPPVTDPR